MKSTRIAVAGATGRVGRHLVDVLKGRGHDVVPISRSGGVDLVTGDGLAEALTGVDAVIDVASTPSPEQQAATEYFTTATANLHKAGEQAGVRLLVVVSIIGIDGSTTGYSAAKLAHEQVALDGPIPARILRAAQFHEFVEQMMQWSTQGDVVYLPKMRTKLVAARTVAEALADIAADPASVPAGPPFAEIAGPREESLVEAAKLLVARRGLPLRIEAVSSETDRDMYESGALLPGPHATLGGPTFEEWLERTQ
jgi:uncharacterized protein YbjT (DUF2867 family)